VENETLKKKLNDLMGNGLTEWKT